MDHPFAVWLLDHAGLLNQYFQRQFQQIIACLCDRSGEAVISECNHIRQQLMSLPKRHGIDMSSFPQLSVDDFWVMKPSKED